MKVLLVEDEKELLQSMVAFLKESGMVCEQAIDLASALEKIDLYDYDCIVLDIGLPDGNGLKLIEEMQKKEHKTGIVIAVSYTHLRAHETVLDLVCRLLLEKKKNTHIHPELLINKINTYI